MRFAGTSCTTKGMSIDRLSEQESLTNRKAVCEGGWWVSSVRDKSRSLRIVGKSGLQVRK